MKLFDSRLYNDVTKVKRPTEIFLGFIQKDWKYSMADYIADCIESIPLSIFDKAVCGLLNVESQLSFTQIGDILGLNIVDDEQNMQYCDHAEEELLLNALDEMVEYDMIARSVFDASYYRLTERGKIFLEEGKKLRTRSNVNFRLFFDWTTGMHKDAKKVFEKIEEGKIVSDDVNPSLTDESFLKTFMYEQQPDIYNHDGNSFSNLKIKKVQNVVYSIYVGLLYDFAENSYRLVAADENSNMASFFNKSIELNEDIYDTLLKEALKKCKRVASNKSIEQQEFEEASIALANTIPGKKESEKQEAVIEFDKSRDLYEIEYFWTNLENIIDSNANRFYFFIPFISSEILKQLFNYSKGIQNKYVYITYNDSESKLDLLIENVFFLKQEKELFSLACYCASDLVYEYIDYVHSFESISFATSVIVKKSISSFDIEQVDKNFANAILPRAIKFVESELIPRNFSGNIDDIERVKWYISMLEQFGSWQDKLGYTSKIAALKVRQKKILNNIKQEHESSLMNEIKVLVNSTDLSKIRKLDKIYSLHKHLDSIQSESLEDYQNVNTSISDLKNALEQRERFIKDTLISKYFVFDTNVFLDDPHILSKVKYQDYVILAARVTEELNKHKTNKEQTVAKNAQMAIKLIGNERRKENGHLIFERAKLDLLPNEFSRRDADNMILAVALNHQKENLFLVSSDEGLLQKSLQVKVPCLSLNEFYSFIENREIERRKDIEETKRNKSKK